MIPSKVLFKTSLRAKWKGPFFVAFPNLQTHMKTKAPIYTHARNCDIIPNFVGLNFRVHNGKDYLPVTITEEMIGWKLGHFSHSKKSAQHSPTLKGSKR